MSKADRKWKLHCEALAREERVRKSIEQGREDILNGRGLLLADALRLVDEKRTAKNLAE